MKSDPKKVLLKIRRRSQEPTENTNSESHLWGTAQIANSTHASKVEDIIMTNHDNEFSFKQIRMS